MTANTADYNFITDRLAIGNVASRAVPGFSAVVTILATDRPGTLACEQTGAPSVPNGDVWHYEWYRDHGHLRSWKKSEVPILIIDLADGEGHYLGCPIDRELNRVASRGLEDYLDDATAFIAEHLKRGCVLVHCGAGLSRSAAVVIAYLCRYAGMSYSEALGFVKARRPSVAPADCFKAAIEHWLSLRALADKGPRR